MWNQIISDFCARHALLAPDPDERGHLQFGFDGVDVSLFEDRGRLYLMSRVARVPDEPEPRERLIGKACAYLLPYLYTDECLINLYDSGEEQYLILVSVMTEADGTDALENNLASLVNRTEGLTASLESSGRPGVENRIAVFRP